MSQIALGNEDAHAVGVVVQLADVRAFAELAGPQCKQDGPTRREMAAEPLGGDVVLDREGGRGWAS
jgi:hypothetical protein